MLRFMATYDRMGKLQVRHSSSRFTQSLFDIREGMGTLAVCASVEGECAPVAQEEGARGQGAGRGAVPGDVEGGLTGHPDWVQIADGGAGADVAAQARGVADLQHAPSPLPSSSRA